jgi:hypothetical protein
MCGCERNRPVSSSCPALLRDQNMLRGTFFFWHCRYLAILLLLLPLFRLCRVAVRLLAMKVVTSMSPSAGVLALASADFELAEVLHAPAFV